MPRTHRLSLALACTIGLAVPPVFAGTHPTPPPSSQTVGVTQVPGTATRLPDVSVAGAWLGKGTATHTDERFEPLGRNPWVGERVSLVCDVRMSPGAPTGWAIVWAVDGQPTCGEGDFTTGAPPCEWSWQLPTGGPVFIDYVAHAPGTHTYECRVDAHGAVNERSESNNSKHVSFTARVSPRPLPKLAVPQLPTGPGPQIRRLR